MQTPLVRNAEVRDFEEIVELLKQLWPEKKINVRKVKKIFLEQSAKKDSYSTLVAEAKGKIVGLIIPSYRLNIHSEGVAVCIDELVVDKNCRSNGIGRALIEAGASFCRKRKIAGVSLTSAFHRKGAHIFYEKMGFEKVSFKFEKEV